MGAEFSKKKEFVEEILPLVKELEYKCNLNRIPMFATFAVEDSGKKTTYRSAMLSPIGNKIRLSQDYFANFSNCLNGFTTIDKQPDLVMDENEAAIQEWLTENTTASGDELEGKKNGLDAETDEIIQELNQKE